ncbi:54S ribosomal protein L17, mitochondrial [Psilocybe cubensis]|uniref:54S ribosomal protein L17, mitochondrial n=2 Tax=Psilocybe cubensis TaxID=181762 RepID=A0ACB8H823_PSICU|nr:54S ribosomal protein L17, mitochondrial [Psilocybe cubensis]KAH9483832.1 54S ribosomal protein L17, mitochondrial [Psilocybe cubensis]
MLSRIPSRCAVVGPSFRRGLATEATTASSQQPSPSQLPSEPAKKPSRPHIKTAIILNRSPILTRTPTAFEKAYYSYQARIRRALHNPFPYEFYFKQGTLLETRFNLEERKRERLAFGPGFLEKEDISEEKRQANIAAVEQLAQQEGEGEELMPRQHEADIKNDQKSLDRMGQRNLYLVVQVTENGKDIWRFPQGDVEKGQLLHQAAQKNLLAVCGDKMDTWIVGRAPVGVHKPEPQSDSPESVIFFHKAHIMAGQVVADGKNIKDFRWLSYQEIRDTVEPSYWESIKDILSEF